MRSTRRGFTGRLDAGVPAARAEAIVPLCCPAYPGDPARNIFRDGYFLYVKMDDFPCGNGIAEGDEQCDIGAANGSLTSCCNSICQLRGSDFSCRDAAGVCDQAEVCSGSSPVCGADAKKLPLTPCTNDGNVCTDDVCNGSGGCEHVANAVPCDDGLFCTEPDRCGSFACSGPLRQCPTGTSCDEVADLCQATAASLQMTISADLFPTIEGRTVVDYTTRITNSGGGVAKDVTWWSPIPPGTEFFSTLSASKGVPTLQQGSMGYIEWIGDIEAAETVEIHHDVGILPGTACSQPIENFATILQTPIDAHAVVVVGCTPLAVGACPGDCDQDDEVTVDELIAGVNIRLEQISRPCGAVDVDGNKIVTTGESLMGLDNALAGCPFSYGQLAGSWFGPLLIANTEPFLQTLAISADGVVERPVPALRASLAPLDRANRIYSLTRDDELTGVLQFSPDGRHAVYVDEYNGFGALEKGAAEPATSYGDSDLGDFWSGSVARYGPAGRVEGAHEDFTVEEALPFVGSASAQGFALSTLPFFIASSSRPLAISQTPAVASFGGFEGDWDTSRGEPRSGDAFFWMTPDKDFMAARTCDGPFPQCGVSSWSRLLGSFQERCHDCQPVATTPPILICTCPRDDGQSEIRSQIPLPCAGAIENIDGVLTCTTVSEIFVLNNDVTSLGDPSSIAVHSLQASGNVPPVRVISGPSTGLGEPLGLAVDAARGEIFVTNNGDSVLVFGITANGDVAPLRTLAGPATGLNRAWGIAVDAPHDEIFVANSAGITVYSRTASGNAPPLRQIDIQTGFIPVMLALDASHDEVYALGVVDDVNRTSRIEVYARTADMMAPPLRTVAGPSTGLDGGNGINVNPARGEFLVANFGTNSILAYAKSASGDAPPLRSLTGPATTLAGPPQVALDAATDTIVASQFFSSTINVYARSASGDTAPLRTIAGPATGLSFPLDLVVVRRPPP